MTAGNFNRYCEELLARYTRRNQQAVTRHLESLCNIISDEEHIVQTMYDRVNSHTRGILSARNHVHPEVPRRQPPSLGPSQG